MWSGRSNWEGVLPEIELFIKHSIAFVCCFHVLISLWDRDIEIQIKAQNGSCNEHNENGKSSVFKISDLNLHGSKLDTPADVAAGRRWLKSNVLPIGGLKVLKVVGLGEVQLLEIFIEDDNGVANK